VSLNDFPGLQPLSWGYVGSDGRIVSSHVKDSRTICYGYGERFGAGDIVGCCINLDDRTAFFTKNGTRLGKVIGKVVFGIDADMSLFRNRGCK
jgi:hypothetical protein